MTNPGSGNPAAGLRRSRLTGAVCLLLGLAACRADRATTSYDEAIATAEILRIERDWAQVAVTGDPAIIDSIFGDDFIGINPDGARYSKQGFIADTKANPLGFVSNVLNEVTVRFFGDVALAQGGETFTRQNGGAGRFVWTDVLVRRSGRWLIVAAEDVVAPVTAPASGKGLFEPGQRADSQK